MAKNKFNMKSGLILILGVFLLLAVFNIDLSNTISKEGGDSREAKPVYDGKENEFKITLMDQAEKAIVGEYFWMDLKVENPGQTGAMYVQCSILDKDANTWLQSVVDVDNCVVNEPFTQTAKVSLGASSSERVTFTVKVPNAVDKNNVIFCDAYEQCASSGDPMGSSQVVKPVTLLPRSVNTTSPVDNEPGDACVAASDCNSWFINDQVCTNGYCIDKADSEEGIPNLSVNSFKGWVAENKMATLGIAIALVIIGAIYVYKDDPKAPPGFDGILKG